jgi:hypothetical protein
VLKHLFGHNGLPMLEEKDRKQRGVLDITATEIHERPETSVARAEATQPEEILQSSTRTNRYPCSRSTHLGRTRSATL